MIGSKCIMPLCSRRFLPLHCLQRTSLGSRLVGKETKSVSLLWPKLRVTSITECVDLKGRRCQKVWDRFCNVFDTSNDESLLSMSGNGIPLEGWG